MIFVCILELVMFGVGYHHAGLSTNDRRSIETMFTNGELPVLCEYMGMRIEVVWELIYYILFL